MSDFECSVVRIEEVSPIVGADRIQAVRIGGYQSIVEKGRYFIDDLAVYIPCGSLVPVDVQEELGLVGKLSGSGKNRVKEIKLKGVLSEGLVYPLSGIINRIPTVDTDYIMEGANCATLLGITKWEPAIPAQMAGRVKPCPFTMGYDIENIKKYSRVFLDDEPVVFSEKVHGTLIQVGLIHQEDGTWFTFVTSKGLGKAGIILEDCEANAANLYLRVVDKYHLCEKLAKLDQGDDLYLFGEVYGTGIQDLGYGAVLGDPQFAAFDIYEGKKGFGQFHNVGAFSLMCASMDIPTVNYIYEGPFNMGLLHLYTVGNESMSGKELHLREGIVVRPLREREEHNLGRVCLKSISSDYALRKGETTEFN